MSQSDIEAGERWATKVAKELEASNFGILAITRENISSPWILFEAGALAKSMEEGRVIPLLLDLDFKDITGPLAQFQAKKVERQGIVEIVESINRLAEQPVPEARLAQLLELAWPDLEKKVSAIPKNQAVTKHNRPQGEVLEELVASVRGLDARLGDVFHYDSPRYRRARRNDPMFFVEALHVSDTKPGDPLRLLIIASMFRDEVPWLYELAMEAYRAANGGSPHRARTAVKRLWEELRKLRRGPLLDIFAGSKSMHIAVEEATHLLDREMRQITVRPRPKQVRSEAAKQAADSDVPQIPLEEQNLEEE